VRKEINDWTDDEFAHFRDAIKELKKSGKYDEFTDLHVDAHAAHGHDNFLPFHRKYIDDFETQLQVAVNDCSLTLPFWNWAEETGAFHKSLVWASNRYGHLAGGCLNSGVADDWRHRDVCVHRDPPFWSWTLNGVLPSWPELYRAIVSEFPYERMRPILEAEHGGLHCMVGGFFCDFRSPADPIFYAHHAFIDRVWYSWQAAYHEEDGSKHCGACDTLVDFDNAPAEDYVGHFDAGEGCVKYPATEPTRCLSYLARSPRRRRTRRRRTRRRRRSWWPLRRMFENSTASASADIGDGSGGATDRAPDDDGERDHREKRCSSIIEQIDRGKCSVSELEESSTIEGCEHEEELERYVGQWFANMAKCNHTGTDGLHHAAGGLVDFVVAKLRHVRRTLGKHKKKQRRAANAAENKTCMDCSIVCSRGIG